MADKIEANPDGVTDLIDRVSTPLGGVIASLGGFPAMVVSGYLFNRWMYKVRNNK